MGSRSFNVHFLFAPASDHSGMTLSTAERRALDRIEIMLLATDPHLASTLDMEKMRLVVQQQGLLRRLTRRGRTR